MAVNSAMPLPPQVVTKKISFFSAVKCACLREWKYLHNHPWDKAMITWFPLILLSLMAWFFVAAVPRGLPFVVVDADRTDKSRALIRLLDATPALERKSVVGNLQEAEAWIKRREADAIVIIPEDFSKKIMRGESVSIIGMYNASLNIAGTTSFREIDAALTEFNTEFAMTHVAAVQGPTALGAAPITVDVRVLFNAGRSFEIFLLGLVFPAILHLLMSVAAASSLCRELRDSTAQNFLETSDNRLVAGVIGKLSIYWGALCLYGVLGLAYLCYWRGYGFAGSVGLWVLGFALMQLAYCAIMILFVGTLKSMTRVLSCVGIYAATSIAFCGATFPIDHASWFARLWHFILPYTSFIKLDAEQRYMAASFQDSWVHLVALMAFILIPAVIGFWAYKRALHNPLAWGLQ